MPNGRKSDVVAPWFEALSEMGEFVGIRFGFRPDDQAEPVWEFLPHSEIDGVGGFVRLLREHGALLENVPELVHTNRIRPSALWNAIPGFCRSRRALKWKFEEAGSLTKCDAPPQAVSWCLFSTEDTERIRDASRGHEVSVNSFLLKHLDTVVRQDLEKTNKPISWMVPVNLRGPSSRSDSGGNHSGYVTARIKDDDSMNQVHAGIYRNLAMGQHMLTKKSYGVGRFLSSSFKKKLIRMNRVMAEPYVGGFSNLGQWDPDCRWKGEALEGGWFFCPPVLRCQMIGAGCVTYQNRLSLTLQIHPELSVDQELADRWMRSWSETIKLDFG